jgi:kinetochore protein NDC80
MTNYLSDPADPTLQIPEHVPENFSDELHHWTLAFDYYSNAYGAFLFGKDEFPEEREALEQRYGEHNNFRVVIVHLNDRNSGKGRGGDG